MELSQPIITFLTALFGGLLLLYVHRLNARRAAAAKFRAAILGALNSLYTEPVNWPRDAMNIDKVLRDAFPALQIAIAEFGPFVPWWRRRAFRKAWHKYRLGKDGREIDLQSY
jgi:hypothetical protein